MYHLTVCSSPGHETISEYVEYHIYIQSKPLFKMFLLEKFNVFDLLSGQISEKGRPEYYTVLLFCIGINVPFTRISFYMNSTFSCSFS